MPYTYNNHPIIIPQGAEVSSAFGLGPNSVFRDIVQRALNEIEPWQRGQDPVHTFYLPRLIGARVAQLADIEEPLWGVNPYHKARSPGLSPFVRLASDDQRNTTDLATLELKGEIERPLLTRVYPGEYMPPLPWMSSARNALGGREACLDYWHNHAFILRRPDLDLSAEGPEWYVPGFADEATE